MTVIFDVGGVLAGLTDQFERAAAVLGSTPEEVGEVYWDRLAYDLGCPDLEYWGRLAGALGVELDADRADLLGRQDAESWCRIRPEAGAVLADLRDAGVRVALLSNAPTQMGRRLAEAHWRDLYDFAVVSADHALVKPDPAIYQLTQTLLGEPASDLHFIDDRQANVDAARDAGWDAHLWVSDADTRAWLTGLGLLVGTGTLEL